MDQKTFEMYCRYASKHDRRTRGEGYAIAALEPRESVFIPCTENPDRYRSLVASVGRRNGMEFCVRVQYDLIDGTTLEGVRVTRVK